MAVVTNADLFSDYRVVSSERGEPENPRARNREREREREGEIALAYER